MIKFPGDIDTTDHNPLRQRGTIVDEQKAKPTWCGSKRNCHCVPLLACPAVQTTSNFPTLEKPEPYYGNSDTRNPAHFAQNFIDKKLLYFYRDEE